MQHVNSPFMAILLAGLIVWPLAASAQEALEDIDETMVVIDNATEIDAEIDKLEKVRDRGVSKEDWQDEAGDTATDDAPPETAIEDYFDSDPEELEDVLEIDDDFEDGDEVDDDLASDPT